MFNNFIKTTLIVVGIVLFITSYFIRNAKAISENKDLKVLSTLRITKVSQDLPVRLVIPSLNINANVQNVGVTKNGEMDSPNTINDAGWYNLGPKPGEIGSAVIAGHLDGVNSEKGVFFNLHRLKRGDEVYIQNNNGAKLTFIVQKINTYDVGYAEDVFSSNDLAHLNLITCTGIWDANKKDFNKRLVVFTDIKI